MSAQRRTAGNTALPETIIQTKGPTPSNITNSLTLGKADLLTENSIQESAKTAMKNAPAATQITHGYNLLASTIDLLTGIDGKESNEARQASLIRKGWTARKRSSSSSSS